MRKQRSRDRGSGDLDGTQLSSTGASRASWHATAPSWLQWACGRAGCSLPAGTEALGMAPCGAGPAAAACPWLRRSEPSGPVGGRRRRGVPGLKGSRASRGLSRPGPLAAPSIGTGNTHTPMCQPRVGPRASPVPEHGDSAVLPFLGAMPEGARVGLEQGSTSRVVVVPIPRHLGGGEHGGTRQDLHPGAGAIQAHADPGIGSAPPVPLSPSAPLLLSCARRVTDGALSPHYVCLSK